MAGTGSNLKSFSRCIWGLPWVYAPGPVPERSSLKSLAEGPRYLLAVEAVDHICVLGVDDPALELERRCQLLGLGGPLGGQELERLHLLRPGEVSVRAV